jgi:hypothetical protein
VKHQHDPFHEGQRLWVHLNEGEARPAVYVGSAEGLGFLGGPPLAYVLLTDTREGVEVELDRLTARED